MDRSSVSVKVICLLSRNNVLVGVAWVGRCGVGGCQLTTSKGFVGEVCHQF